MGYNSYSSLLYVDRNQIPILESVDVKTVNSTATDFLFLVVQNHTGNEEIKSHKYT